MPFNLRPNRRHVLAGAAAAGAVVAAPAIVTADVARPVLPSGIMSGDVDADRAVIWSRADRPARLIVEWSTDEKFTDARRVIGPAALAETDFTAKLDLSGLPAGALVHYRVRFESLVNPGAFSAPQTGRFKAGGDGARDVSFVFSGDEAGQGWGINQDWGGYRLYETMRRTNPDFFIHSGDQIYADGPLKAEVTLDDGSVWRNLVTEAKSKVATSLADYRGNFAYNLLDDNKRRFAAEVPFLVQWDDHEVRNNWYPGQIIGDPRYAEQPSASLLAALSCRAMMEYNPIRQDGMDPERLYRACRISPLLDVIALDERSYRGPNTPNRQTARGAEADFLGPTQTEWVKARLAASTATWKVIASDMPISIIVRDLNPDVVKGTYEAWANGDDGKPLGRELEIADLLAFIKRRDIKNVVWVTADVHYPSATWYTPDRAAFGDFKPFWEFVAGPINAGTFGPGTLDKTFGPDLRFVGIPDGMKQNRPPSDGFQFFGHARIDAKTRVMTVAMIDVAGKTLFSTDIAPEA